MESVFVKRLEDLVREELLVMGYAYDELIAGIEQGASNGPAIVRFRPPHEDLQIEPPPNDMPAESFAASVRRRLRVNIEGPDRSRPPID